jgi:hypothetical protein
VTDQALLPKLSDDAGYQLLKDGGVGKSEVTGCARFGVAGRTADCAAMASVRCRVARDDAVVDRLVSTKTSARTVFLIVDRPNSVSHWSTGPAVIIATGM